MSETPGSPVVKSGLNGDARRGVRRGIQSIEIGFRIIDALVRARNPVPLKEIAARTSLPASNAHFYLVSLIKVGMVSQDHATGHYCIGPYGLEIGIACLEQFDLFTVARPLLADLALETGYTVFLGVWGNHGPTIVYRVEGRRSRGTFELRIGSVLPLLSSALGRVFLSYLPQEATQEQLDAELREAEASLREAGRKQSAAALDVPTDRAGVRHLIDQVREERMSRCRRALLSDFTALSAPIQDHAGNIIAAVTVMGPIGVFNDEFDGEVARLIKSTGTAISLQAGFRRPEPGSTANAR